MDSHRHNQREVVYLYPPSLPFYFGSLQAKCGRGIGKGGKDGVFYTGYLSAKTQLLPSPSCIKSLVKFLVEQLDVYPNTANKDGETLLFRATRNWHEAVVTVLLELQDMNPNTRNKSLTTPLSIA